MLTQKSFLFPFSSFCCQENFLRLFSSSNFEMNRWIIVRRSWFLSLFHSPTFLAFPLPFTWVGKFLLLLSDKVEAPLNVNTLTEAQAFPMILILFNCLIDTIYFTVSAFPPSLHAPSALLSLFPICKRICFLLLTHSIIPQTFEYTLNIYWAHISKNYSHEWRKLFFSRLCSRCSILRPFYCRKFRMKTTLDNKSFFLAFYFVWKFEFLWVNPNELLALEKIRHNWPRHAKIN